MEINKFTKSVVFGLFIAIFFSFGLVAFAYSPTLTMSSSGSDAVINISGGQPNASVILSYTPSGSNLPTTITGMTDYSGNFSTTVSSAYGLNISSQIYATVGGQQATLNYNGYNGGCTYNCGNPYGLSLSQNNLNLTVGQSMPVTAYNYGGSIYISANTNSYVATPTVSGNQITVYGNQLGVTNISVCANNNNACATLYVLVSGSGGYGSLSLSQTNLNLNVGQSGSVTANNTNSGTIYISSNTNSGAVTATVSGQVINFYGLQSGNATVLICANNSSQCASVYVTVSGSGYSNNNVSMTDSIYSPKVINISLGATVVWTNNGNMVHTVTADDNSFTSGNILPGASYSRTFSVAGSFAYHCNFHGGIGGSGMSGVVIVGNTGLGLTLAQNSVNMAVSQSTSVAITGAGGYFISGNSNPGVVNATISGSSVYLNSLSIGNSTINICQNLGSSQCATLFVNVTSGNGGSTVWFSQNTVNLTGGQTSAVTVYSNNYNGNFYISGNTSSGVVLANISGNILNLTGQAAGASTITVCQGSSSINCGSVYVTVGGGGNGNLSLSQTNLSLGANQSASVNIYGSGNYFVSTNTNSAVASATLSGSVLNVYAGAGGNTTITVCQSGTSVCATLYVTVNASLYGSLLFNSVSLPVMVVGQYYSYQLQASGGTPPYTYTLMSGFLPNGLTLSPNGMISGIPNAGQTTASFTVRASDNFSRSATANFTIGSTYSGTGVQYPGGVLGASAFANGTLIAEGPTVYIVYKNTKSAFTSASVFLNLGFKFSNVLQVGGSTLVNSGYTISTFRAQHPWGSWIKSGQTIYFVHESGLIPVPDYGTFLNNGGKDNLVVSANLYDFSLPVLSTMVSGDPRLQ